MFLSSDEKEQTLRIFDIFIRMNDIYQQWFVVFFSNYVLTIMIISLSKDYLFSYRSKHSKENVFIRNGRILFSRSLSLHLFIFVIFLSLSEMLMKKISSLRFSFRFSKSSSCNNEVASLWSKAIPMLYGDINLGYNSIHFTRNFFLYRSCTLTRWFRCKEHKHYQREI